MSGCMTSRRGRFHGRRRLGSECAAGDFSGSPDSLFTASARIWLAVLADGLTLCFLPHASVLLEKTNTQRAKPIEVMEWL